MAVGAVALRLNSCISKLPYECVYHSERDFFSGFAYGLPYR